MKTLHLMLCLVTLAAVGCGGRNAGSSTSASAATPRIAGVRGEVEVRFPGDWLPYVENDPFDLLWVRKQSHLTTGLFVYDKAHPVKLSADATLQHHVDEIRSEHTNFAIVKDRTEKQIDNRTLVTVVCRGDNSDQKGAHYRVTLVKFSDSKVFVVAVQGGDPQDFQQAEPVFAEITDSISRPK